MRQLQDKWYEFRESMRQTPIRENKKLMSGIAAAICLLAILVLARGLFFAADRAPEAPSHAQAANEAVVEHLRQADTGQRFDEEPLPEPGIGRMLHQPSSP